MSGWTIALAATAAAGLLVHEGGTFYQSGSESLAYPGESDMGVPSSSLPCATCHGIGAEGGREGGVTAPPIDQASLADSTPLRASYDLEAFRRAVRDGVSPDGRRLNTVMPRYRLTSGEIGALWAHLGEVAARQRRGISPQEVRFGILVAPGGEERGRALARMAQQAWSAKASPIFGRNVRFDLIVVDTDAPREVARKVAEAPVLAVLFLTDPGGKLHAALADEAVPSVFPLTALRGTETHRMSLALFASRADQIQALLDAAGPEVPILADADGRALLEEISLAEAGRLRPIGQVRSFSGKAVVVAGAAGIRRLASLDLKGAHLFGIADEIASILPQLLTAGSSVTVADPRAPPLASGPRRPDLERFMDAAIALLEEGLSRSGRDVTRSGLFTSIRSTSVSAPDWPALDYRKYVLTGTATVSLRTIRTNEAAAP